MEAATTMCKRDPRGEKRARLYASDPRLTKWIYVLDHYILARHCKQIINMPILILNITACCQTPVTTNRFDNRFRSAGFELTEPVAFSVSILTAWPCGPSSNNIFIILQYYIPREKLTIHSTYMHIRNRGGPHIFLPRRKFLGKISIVVCSADISQL